MKNIRTNSVDLVISKEGFLALTFKGKNYIQILDQEGKEIRKLDTNPLCPFEISKTDNDELLVILQDKGDEFDLLPTSRRLVQRMTLTGTVFNKYEFREDGKTRLFTLPVTATENKNTDVCIVNWLSANMGEL